MATLITFSPSTTIKSADVNANFSNLANGSAFTSGATIDSLNLTTLKQVSGLYDNGTQKGTYNIDWSNGDRQTIVCDHTGNLTLTYSNAKAGQVLTLVINEDSTGGSTITLPSTKWVNSGAGVFTTTASAINVLTVLCDKSGNYLTALSPNFG